MNRPDIKDWRVWTPLLITLAFIGGMWTGRGLSPRSSASDEKLRTILDYIRGQYVEEVNIDSLMEGVYPSIMAQLDPHSVYIPAADLLATNQELEGSFSGIGVSFNMLTDTINIVEIIPGGPAEKVGLLAGDRIVTINDSSAVGSDWNTDRVFRTLRGPEGTKVKVGVMRSSAPGQVLEFEVTRGMIPVTSIDAIYRPVSDIVYIKVNRFGENTYSEFLQGLVGENYDPAKDGLIVDLRGNGGGYMNPSVLMANEFLPRGAGIVATRGRLGIDDQAIAADGSGSWQTGDMVVLIDEYSASASEIFAGAMQDNDRALVIGRRSFGKGLVQNQFTLPDSSAIRLTVARYYTPSGRCIQKAYRRGHADEYAADLFDRYARGELMSADSIHFDPGLLFHTASGRVVYAAGGIMPDIFVAADTSQVTSWYLEAVNAGMVQKFAFDYTDRHRAALSAAQSVAALWAIMPGDDDLLNEFVEYARLKAGIQPRWYYINISKPLIVTALRAWIARDILGASAFQQVFNTTDTTVSEAIDALRRGKARAPLLPSAEDNQTASGR